MLTVNGVCGVCLQAVLQQQYRRDTSMSSWWKLAAVVVDAVGAYLDAADSVGGL